MGVTAIRRIRNESRSRFEIQTLESGRPITIYQTASSPVDIWIPWATTEDQWDGHRIMAAAYRRYTDGTRVYWRRYAIWQGIQDDRVDRVRCTYGEPTVVNGALVREAPFPQYANPGPVIPGVSRVNGGRVLYVRADLSIELATNL
jgi:hypothetical protein